MSAALLSLSLHAAIFYVWPHVHATPKPHIAVQGELIAPVPEVAAPPPLAKPPEPEPVRPPTPPRAVQKDSPKMPQKQAPDTGVALPVLADKGDQAAPSDDFVVPEAPPNKLPFATRTGIVPLDQYMPSSAPPVALRPPAPDVEDEVNADELGAFGRDLRERAARAGGYPAIALKRGWHGVVRVKVSFNRDGFARQVSVKDSSGHKVLDDRALEMVRQACAELVFPDALSHRAFSVVVPVDFKLQP